MCGRMFQKRSVITLIDLVFPRDLADLVKPLVKEAIEKEADTLFPNFDIRPTNQIVIFTADEEQRITPRIMAWGGKPSWSKRTLFNSRDDKLDGRAWSKSFFERRCLIPCDGFFEWTGEKGSKQAHAISRSDGNPMLFAGLWRHDADQDWSSIITTDASDWMQEYHHREPAMIRPDQVEDYLVSDDPPYDLIAPSRADELQAFACASPKRDQEPKPLRELF